LGNEGAEALSGRALEGEPDGVVGQPGRTVPARDLAADDGTDHAVAVADGQRGRDGLLPLERRRAQGEQRRLVQRLLQAVLLRDLAVAAHVGTDLGTMEDGREVQAARL